jgi:hypothetical protein
LGWTYQFWQAQRKDEINDSGKKIGADELAPVTQLFTEDYMVEFLLHNTLGAWWAGKLGPIQGASEAAARSQAALPSQDGVPEIAWTYLRFAQDEKTNTWLPAAGTFEGWPKSARDVRLLDPCMGSGHFLVFALPLLVRLRMEDEKIPATAAVIAVLKDNVHGLELDERCTQIAAFNLALTAWKLVGYQKLPPLHLACSGLAPSGTEAEWVALAGDDDRLRRGIARLHKLFKHAPVLGSLINPRAQAGDLIEADYQQLAPLLETALAVEEKEKKVELTDDSAELVVVAQGIAKAAELLADRFTLVATNVPYLGGGKQGDVLRDYCERVYSEAKGDLGTCFLERCFDLCGPDGSEGVVTPQGWWFSSRSVNLRASLLSKKTFRLIVTLGEEAWQTFGNRGPLAVLMVINNCKAAVSNLMFGSNALPLPTIEEKIVELQSGKMIPLKQSGQYENPDHRITISEALRGSLLESFAICPRGIVAGDGELWFRQFWELENLPPTWRPLQAASSTHHPYSGRTQVIDWAFEGIGMLRPGRGNKAYGSMGVAVSRMRSLNVTLYTGELYEQSVAVIVPHDESHLLALWSYCTSAQFYEEIRKLDNKVNVTPATLLKVQFDLPRWREVAGKKYPQGLPEAFSSDLTQWLFNGHPKGADQPLHVAVTRLLGYRWPRQTGSSFPDCPAIDHDGLEKFADEDGIVCLPAVNREQPAAGRLRQLLTGALGTFDERALVASAGLKGSKSKTFEDWLRDEFFEQHARLFQDRPFIWHLWDGRADGFHALVNYHRLNHANLQKLTYSYLGDWIQQQAEDTKADKPGAAERLGAARVLQNKLAAILEGEAPLDIFVRWKPLKEQAQGWHPDLNDGIRQNIRPFLLAGDVGKRGAGLFRTVPLSLKDKDRGTEPERPKKDYPWFWCEEQPDTDPKGGKDFVGNRWNDVHLTLETKQKARA